MQITALGSPMLAARPLPAQAAADRFVPSSAPLDLIPRPVQQEAIPDARAIAGDPNLRYVDLNRAINRSYGAFGRLFQEVVGGEGDYPTWYAMAAYASRMAGRSMLAADCALEAVKAVSLGQPAPNEETGGVAGGDSPLLTGLIGDVRLAAVFLLAFFTAQEGPGSDASAFLDPRTLAISAHRLAQLIQEQPGCIADRFAKVAETAKNALEDGNRRIFTDIGVAGQDFLTARRAKGRALTTEECCALAPDPTQARELYDYAVQVIEGEAPLEPPKTESTNMLAAAFALYEGAGRLGPGKLKNRTIEMANNMLAFHEQFTIVQPAFSNTPEGEANREKLFRAVTPDVKVKNRRGTWRYSEFASRSLPPLDLNPLTPRVTEYNWAHFLHRWPGIMSFFGECYQNPQSNWPMPNPEPSKPV